jgi:D-aminopeptidase
VRARDLGIATGSAEPGRQALAAAAPGPVSEGSVGGGTGMICHGFKGGIGTASQVAGTGFTVGVLVQATTGGESS